MASVTRSARNVQTSATEKSYVQILGQDQVCVLFLDSNQGDAAFSVLVMCARLDSVFKRQSEDTISVGKQLAFRRSLLLQFVSTLKRLGSQGRHCC